MLYQKDRTSRREVSIFKAAECDASIHKYIRTVTKIVVEALKSSIIAVLTDT